MTPEECATRLRKAAFLDRDGVINEERAFVHRIEDFVFVHGAVDALRDLQAAEYLLVIITNQSGIARGLYTEADYLKLTLHMQERVEAAGVKLDAVEYCPHLPDALVAGYRVDCACRKPGTGMLDRARSTLGIDMAKSILIGDRSSDIEAGRRAGVGRCFFVRSGNPLAEPDIQLADGIYDDLAACVRYVLSREFQE